MKIVFVFILLTFTVSLFADGHTTPWKPVKEFDLEGATLNEAVHWLSGWSYALTEIGKSNKKNNTKSDFCLPKHGYIESRALFQILNEKFKGQSISSEQASEGIWSELPTHYPCK